jgi:RimJ/RimL family protein N-acetyltransferase
MLEFRKISEFPRGTLYNQLVDAYSIYDECKKIWDTSWKEYDNYFYDNLDIVSKYSFITVLDGKPIGHISWDPRHRPNYVEIGHNCIINELRGKGYGHLQLEEAIRRIMEYDNLKKIIVTTNEIFIPAQRNYESVGFKKVCERENKDTPFSGKYIDYEIKLKKN